MNRLLLILIIVAVAAVVLVWQYWGYIIFPHLVAGDNLSYFASDILKDVLQQSFQDKNTTFYEGDLFFNYLVSYADLVSNDDEKAKLQLENGFVYTRNVLLGNYIAEKDYQEKEDVISGDRNTTAKNILNLTVESIQANHLGASYAAFKDVILISDEEYRTGKKLQLHETINGGLFFAQVTAQSGLMAFGYTQVVENLLNTECGSRNYTESCVRGFFNRFETTAEAERSSIQPYSFVGVGNCPNNLAYLKAKDFELEIRRQLNISESPFLVFWRTTLIKSYGSCSDELLENTDCSIIPLPTTMAVAEVEADMGELAKCSSEKIREEFERLAEVLNATR